MPGLRYVAQTIPLGLTLLSVVLYTVRLQYHKRSIGVDIHCTNWGKPGAPSFVVPKYYVQNQVPMGCSFVSLALLCGG